MLKISGVMPIHNEEEYLPFSLNSLKEAPLDELVVVLDRCTDRSEQLLERFKPNYPVKVYHKTWQKWRNPIAEVFEYGFSLASGDILYTLSADAVFDLKIFDATPFREYDMVSYRIDSWDLHASPLMETYEIFLRSIFQKLVRQVWRGFIATKKQVWSELHFRDIESKYGEHLQFIDFKERLVKAGYKHLHVDATRNLDLRAPRSKERQLLEGKGQVILQYSLWRVIIHSILHLKPYVLIGYIHEIRK